MAELWHICVYVNNLGLSMPWKIAKISLNGKYSQTGSSHRNATYARRSHALTDHAVSQKQPGGQKTGPAKLPFTKVPPSGHPVANMRHITVVSNDEYESDDKDTAIVAALSTTHAGELLSPMGKAALDGIVKCKVCDGKPHLFIRKKQWEVSSGLLTGCLLAWYTKWQKRRIDWRC